jgi:hypothetical protein
MRFIVIGKKNAEHRKSSTKTPVPNELCTAFANYYVRQPSYLQQLTIGTLIAIQECGRVLPQEFELISRGSPLNSDFNFCSKREQTLKIQRLCSFCSLSFSITQYYANARGRTQHDVVFGPRTKIEF